MLHWVIIIPVYEVNESGVKCQMNVIEAAAAARDDSVAGAALYIIV